jgi:glycosyltransferase involved in cell wall biosynthesis
MKNVAILLFDIWDISGGGGVERFYSDFFNRYICQNESRGINLHIIGDKTSIDYLVESGFLHWNENIIKLGDQSKYSILNHFKFIWPLIAIINKYNIELIHFPTALSIYLPFLFVKKFFLKNVKTVFNVINCSIASNFFRKEKNIVGLKTHQRFINYIEFDGILSWYKNIIYLHDEYNIFRGKPLLYSIKSYFTSTEKYFPERKENLIVFAARLSLVKNPIMYLAAIKVLKNEHPEIFKSWSFLLYGKGELYNDILNFMHQNDLINYVKLGFESDMHKVFNKSKVFVSTQDFENFTSLSLLEAMASGNIIIARNVGQTSEIVEDGESGFLLEKDTVEDLAKNILNFINNEERYTKMSHSNINKVKKIYTYKNFENEIITFWNLVLKN